MNDFLPVLLGSDANVYGMARGFHEKYKLRSVAISKTIFTATVDSTIIDFILEKNLEEPDIFLNTLIDFAKSRPDTKLLLVPCSDGYVKLLVKFQQELSKFFEFNCLTPELLSTLTMKDSFYEVCDKYGFAYPKTDIVTKDSYKQTEVSIAFPVIVKPCNSVEYWKCEFPNKMKVFVAQDKPEYIRILDAIYGSTYQDAMTIQEFIPGDDSYMRVLNCYVGKDKKVKLMALGHALLEDHTPQGIGSYVAIVGTYDQVLLSKFKFFLEDIGYQGYANFDMKLDMRDGQYKLFETNVRQGRSSYFVTANGYNLPSFLVDDMIYNKDMGITIARNDVLWIQVPKGVVRKYVNEPACKLLVNSAFKQGKYMNSLFYNADLNIKRRIKLTINMLNHYRKYKKYYGKKGLAK